MDVKELMLQRLQQPAGASCRSVIQLSVLVRTMQQQVTTLLYREAENALMDRRRSVPQALKPQTCPLQQPSVNDGSSILLLLLLLLPLPLCKTTHDYSSCAAECGKLSIPSHVRLRPSLRSPWQIPSVAHEVEVV